MPSPRDLVRALALASLTLGGVAGCGEAAPKDDVAIRLDAICACFAAERHDCVALVDALNDDVKHTPEDVARSKARLASCWRGPRTMLGERLPGVIIPD